MEFGNTKDLLLVKKTEHFSKWKNMAKLKPICANIWLMDEWKEKSSLQDRLVEDINTSNITDKKKVRQIRQEKKRVVSEFLSGSIIPKLVQIGFFDYYKIPLKYNKISKKEEWFYWQFN